MDYVKVKELEHQSQEITSEAHLESFLVRNWDRFFNVRLIQTRKRVSRRSVVDILSESDDGKVVIELKFRPIRRSDRRQLNRYVKDASAISGLFIGYNRLIGKFEVVI